MTIRTRLRYTWMFYVFVMGSSSVVRQHPNTNSNSPCIEERLSSGLVSRIKLDSHLCWCKQATEVVLHWCCFGIRLLTFGPIGKESDFTHKCYCWHGKLTDNGKPSWFAQNNTLLFTLSNADTNPLTFLIYNKQPMFTLPIVIIPIPSFYHICMFENV